MNQKTLDHIKNPRNLGMLPQPDGHANPVGDCNESIELFLRIKEDRITRAGFLPHGCAFTLACGSVLTDLIQGRTLDQAFDVTAEVIEETLGGLPEDHKHCAALAARTVKEAISYYYRGGRHNWKSIYSR